MASRNDQKKPEEVERELESVKHSIRRIERGIEEILLILIRDERRVHLVLGSVSTPDVASSNVRPDPGSKTIQMG